MTVTSQRPPRRLRFHRNAYKFVFDALRHTQEQLVRYAEPEQENDDAHISGQELLEGVRSFAIKQFGMLAPVVFRQWGIQATDDFGRIVWELVERGEMRKTDRDHLSDFSGVYDFQRAFVDEYRIDTSRAFSK